MIYCNIKGGLGNVLFQLATGISFAIEHKTEFSVSNFDWHINYLNSEKEFNPGLSHAEEYNFFFKNINKRKHPDGILFIQYPFTFFDDSRLNNDCLIEGYFQSEKYFKNNRKIILHQFKLPFEKRLTSLFKYPVFFKKKLTSIHVRRAGYLTSPIHYNQDIKYYEEAIQKLDSSTDKFIVFSDDITWCKENFKGNKFIFIENQKDYVEIYLMSKCTNNIISNSTFSWWGAWLNEHKNKIVISPKNWFKTNDLSTEDLIPENWIVI